MSEITVVFEVFAGTSADLKRDVSGMSPDELAAVVEVEAETNVSLCHECARDVNDPQVGEMVAFVVDGVEYARDDDGNWVKS